MNVVKKKNDHWAKMGQGLISVFFQKMTLPYVAWQFYNRLLILFSYFFSQIGPTYTLQ